MTPPRRVDVTLIFLFLDSFRGLFRSFLIYLGSSAACRATRLPANFQHKHTHSMILPKTLKISEDVSPYSANVIFDRLSSV